MDDKTKGWMITIASILGIIIYFYLIFISPWSSLTIQVSAFLAIGAILLITAWIGYTLTTTPPRARAQACSNRRDGSQRKLWNH